MSSLEKHVSAGPIFIGGLSFSGKTTLRLMLSSHPLIVLSRRTYMWQRYYGRYGDLSRPENLERCLEAMLAHKSIQALAPDPERIRREFWRGPATYARLFALIHCHFAASIGKRRWGAQIGLIEEYADIIFADYPAARMIHMIRDPRTRQGSASAKSRQRAGKIGWETARWLHSARLAKRNETRYPGRYLVLGHEALLADKEGQLRDICDFLGERFYPEMVTMESAVRFGDSKAVPDHAAAQHAVAENSAPPPQAIQSRDQVFTQVYAGRDIAAFGYDLRPVRLSWKDQLLFNVIDRPANLASMIAWRTLQSMRS